MAITLGLDIGTTSTIGILVDTGGAVLATADAPVTLHSPQAGWAEEDPEQWWANVGSVCRALLAASGVDPRAIACVGVAGMVPALVILDSAGQPIRRSIQQSDARTAAEVEALRAGIDETAFLARTGNGVNQQLIAPKLRWLARHEPQAFARIACLLGSYDFIAHRLTAALGIERNWALEAGFVDLGTNAIAPDLVALAGIAPALLPALRQGTDIVGRVTPAAAAHTGLAAGTEVCAGAADHVASAFAAGVDAPGTMLIKFGGAGDVLLATDAPRPDPRLFLDYHLAPGLFMPNGCMAASGAVLNWLAREFAADLGPRPHAVLDEAAAAIAPGAEGLLLLPYFLGEKTPIHDLQARGSLVGLGLHHSRAHIWRAALEAVCFGFRHHVEVARELRYPVLRLIASDGGAASGVWMQIAADVMGMEVALLEGHPGSCLGAAYVAAVAAGALPDWRQMHRFVRPGRVVAPRTAGVVAYDAIYPVWRDLYAALQPIFPRLAG